MMIMRMEWNRRISETLEQGKCQGVERCQKSVGNIRNIRVQNRKMLEMSEYEKGMEI